MCVKVYEYGGSLLSKTRHVGILAHAHSFGILVLIKTAFPQSKDKVQRGLACVCTYMSVCTGSLFEQWVCGCVCNTQVKVYDLYSVCAINCEREPAV